jgi:phthalate 4,5-dioxygenase oxygenase subunit
MLTAEQNETLMRVGPGTKMGEYMRQFWIPVMRAQRLVADGAPVRTKLLGENFVAFRATDGRVGFFDEGCPHRCTSLALARNEDNALTCIFHGWKIDVSGKVVDVPSEPPERRQEFAAKVRVRHYPVREAGTIIWVYLGNSEQPPAFPDFNFTTLPDDHIACRIGVIGCNWLAVLEGQLDSSHVGFLHRDGSTFRFDPTRPRRGSTVFDTGPRFEIELKPYGFREGAIRHMPDGNRYVRIREWVAPWWSSIPQGAPADDRTWTIAIPLDDTTTAQWDVRYNLTRPLDISDFSGNYGYKEDNDDYAKDIGTMDNAFRQDRRLMKEISWSGYPTGRWEDFAAAIAQGVLADRTREYLGSSDTPIIRARRMLLDAAQRHARGESSLGIGVPVDWKAVEPLDAVISPDAKWQQLSR